MREILFRGKAINDNWYYGVPLVFTENYVCMSAPHTYNKAVIPETVGQYTGLTDKNGKKVFEGDVVQFSLPTDVYVCFWNDGNLEWGLKNENEDFGLAYASRDIEIIGNIHDNPELLKGA